MRVAWAVLVGTVVLWGAAEYRTAGAAPGGVTVHVVDSGGAGVAGVQVSARREERRAPEFRNPVTAARGTTGADGSVRLTTLDPKQVYTLVATAPDARWRDFHDHCRLEWAPADTRITLGPARVLGGVVRDSAKKAVPFARVYLKIGRWESATIADKNGAFLFPNAPPGRGRVRAEVERKSGAPVRSSIASFAPTAKSADVTLSSVPADRASYLIVRVTTPRGRPVMYGDASFESERRSSVFGGSVFSGSMLEGGAARTTEFSKPMLLAVASARSEYGAPLPCGPGKGGPFGPGPREAALQLPVELFIEGRVLGPDKKPLAGIRVQAHPQNSIFGSVTWIGGVHGDGISGPDGRVRIGGLDKREYELRCVQTHDWVGGRVEDARAGKDPVELVMRAAAAPTLTFKDEAGAPVEGALVRVKPPGEDWYRGPEEHDPKLETRTDVKGVARIPGLDPELKYLLTAYPPTARSELLLWEIEGWAPQDTALTFEKARRITGAILDQDKRPVPGARVEWLRTGGSSDKKAKPKPKPGTVTAGDDGRFAMEKLRPGSYRLLALRPAVKRTGAGPAPVERRDVSKPVTVKAGKEDVSLKVAMPGQITFYVWGWDKGLGKPNVLFAAVGDEGIGPASVKKRLDKDGMVVVKGLRWDVTYAIWMGGLRKGKYVYAAGVRPQDAKVSASVEDGATVSGKLESPKGTKARKVWAVYPGFKVAGKIKSGSRFEIVGLPPGPWKLRACGKLGDDLLETEVSCEPDQEPVITLEPK